MHHLLGDYVVTLKIEKGRIGFVEPMLAVAVTKLPEGAAWAYELKFDGDSALGVKAAQNPPGPEQWPETAQILSAGLPAPGRFFQDKARWGLNWLLRCLINPPLCGIA